MNSSARSFGMIAKAIRSVSAGVTLSNEVGCRWPSTRTYGADATFTCRSEPRCSIR